MRKVTTEVAYVRIAPTEEVVDEFNQPGKADVIIAEALREAKKAGTRWIVEDEPLIEIHPIQRSWLS